jgi:predicted O-methyltransferase YrrM
MSTIGDKYLLGSGRSDHDRLRVISVIHDGRTRELLRRAGFVSGQRFVEFGCGLGYVTRWAASEGAHATGIDLNEDNLLVAKELAQEAGLKDHRVSLRQHLQTRASAGKRRRVLFALADGASEQTGRCNARHPCGFEAWRSDGVRRGGCERCLC